MGKKRDRNKPPQAGSRPGDREVFRAPNGGVTTDTGTSVSGAEVQAAAAAINTPPPADAAQAAKPRDRPSVMAGQGERANAARRSRVEPQLGQVDNLDLNGNGTTKPTLLKKPWWVGMLMVLVAVATGLLVTALAGGFDPAPVVIGGEVMEPTTATPSSYAISLLPWLAGLAIAGLVVWALKDKERRKALYQAPGKLFKWLYFKTLGRLFGHKAKEVAPADAAAQANAPQDNTPPVSVIKAQKTVEAVERRALTDILVGGALAVLIVINTVLAVRYVLPQGVYGAKVLYVAAVVLLQMVALLMLYSIYSSFAAKFQVALGNIAGTIMATVIVAAIVAVCWFAAVAMVYTPWLADEASPDKVAVDRWVMWLYFLAVFYIGLAVFWAVTRPLEAASRKARRDLKEAQEKAEAAKAAETPKQS